MKRLQCHKNTHWKTQFSQRFWPPGVRFRDKMGPEIAPRRGLGGSRERPGGLSEPSWPSWALLEPSWGQLGPSWSPLGAILGPLGALLEPAWALLEPPWGHLGPSWSPLGAIFGRLGDILGPLGASGAQKREILKIIKKKTIGFSTFLPSGVPSRGPKSAPHNSIRPPDGSRGPRRPARRLQDGPRLLLRRFGCREML